MPMSPDDYKALCRDVGSGDIDAVVSERGVIMGRPI